MDLARSTQAFTARHLSHDAITFDPFDAVDIDERSREIGSGRSLSSTAPGPEQWLALLDAAARWALDFAKPILRVCDGVMAAEHRYKDYSYAGRAYQVRPVFEAMIAQHF